MRGLIITFLIIFSSHQLMYSQTEEYITQNIKINTNKSNSGVSFFRQNYLIHTLPKSKNNLIDTDFYVSLADETGSVFEGQILDGGFNSYINEISLVFTSDFKKVYFSRSYINNNKEHFDLYVANVSEDNKIFNLTALPINYKNYSNAYPALSADDKTLYFASDRLESKGGFDIFKVDILENGKKFGEVINLGDNVNTTEDEITPFIMGEELFFSSNGRDGFGKHDVFSINTNLNNKAKNLGKTLNSPENDFGFIRKEHRNFGYLVSNRKGGKGNNDIYFFKAVAIDPPIEEVNEKTTDSTTKEIVKNEKDEEKTEDLNSELIDNTIEVVDNISNKRDLNENLQENTAKNIINERDKEVTKNNEPKYEEEIIYEDKTEVASNVYDFQRRTAYNTTKVEVGRILRKIEDLTTEEKKCVGKIKKLNDIYFDLNKFNIRPDARIQVNKAIKIMNKCPNLQFIASSYTDSRGSSEYNKKLSQRRATSVVNYILRNSDLPIDRIIGIGYGESGLKNNCFNGVKCSNKQHQQNRRTEIEVSVIK